jgi:DNA invertase Pin-like site-specific DNA recombinase
MPEPNGIAVYCRVSTKEQSIESQKLEIMRWLTAHGLTESDVSWYVDHETGTTLARDSFNRLEDDIYRGRVTTVIVARSARPMRTRIVW